MATFKPVLRVATLAAAMVFSTSALLAQAEPPAGGPPHARHGMQGPGGIEGAIMRARDRLNLTSAQAAQLDSIVASAKSQAKAAHEASQATIAQIKAELAKPQPNLRTLAQLQDSLMPQRQAIHKSVRDQLLAFYDTLDASQQQTVIEGVRKMATFRERMAQRWTGN